MKIKLRNQAAKDKVETAKLPKLTITPFKGTLLDWQRFWNQFSSEIDTKEMNAVTKLSYLRELVEPKVQVIINGLPFTTEGYARAKSVLQAKYGRPSEVANAHVQAILNMEAVQFNNKHDIRKVHTFYEGLLTNVQVLETMGKLKDIKGYVRLTLDKLPDIRADLVRTDDDWHDWDFDHLLKALQKWTERNPVEILIQQKRDEYRNVSRNQPNRFSLQTRMNKQPVFNSICVYCEKSHKSTECDVLSSTGERKRYLADKKLCFNCVKPRHHANQCESKNSCRICNKRHHTSICENNKDQKGKSSYGKTPTMMASEESKVVYPVVVIYVNGIKCRALLDTGAGSSYVSSFLLQQMNTKPIRRENKTIEMMLASANKKVEVFDVTIENIERTFALKTEVNKVDRKILITLPNPKYDELTEMYAHLKGVTLDDKDKKAELPIHCILGASEYARIKTNNRPKVGNQGEPVAELTRLGWTLICPGRESDITGLMLTQTSSQDYDRLCSLDVLGLAECEEDQREVYAEFKSQLRRNNDGSYETGLIWKAGHPILPTNEIASLARLKNLTKKLSNDMPTMVAYDEIINQQLKDGIIEPVNSQRNDGFNAQRNDAVNSQHNDAVNSQRNDAVNSQHIDAVNSQRNDAVNSQHNDVVNSQRNDAFNAHHNDAFNAHHNDAVNSQRNDAVNSQRNDAVDSQLDDDVNIQLNNAVNMQRSVNTQLNDAINLELNDAVDTQGPDSDEQRIDYANNISHTSVLSKVMAVRSNKEDHRIYYIPHKAVIKPHAETTKLRVVYDASSSSNGVSLNSCLEPGPNMQNLLWSVLLRNRMYPIALCADMKKAFLQIRIKEEDRDVLRFHWIKNLDPNRVVAYRFTRALFGMNQSPFLLQGTLNLHLDKKKDKYGVETIEKLRNDIYVDDVPTGAETINEAKELKPIMTKVFKDGSFELHKWHSNIASLENETDDGEEVSYAKQQLQPRGSSTSILGLKWERNTDQLMINCNIEDKYAKSVTKRSMLHTLASIYDPLGVAGPMTLTGKLLFRECCDQKLPWDQPVPSNLYRRWIDWETSLPKVVSIPRAFNMGFSPIDEINIHTFADASGQGVCATLYVLIHQQNGEVHQGILSAKSRLAKKNQTIPRLELIAAHMAANLTTNTIKSLKSSKLNDIVCWSDSTVVLHWLQSTKEYKAFVTNRVNKINEHRNIIWRHVPTDQNPADAGSRGKAYRKLESNWLNGPDWLGDREKWPPNIVSAATQESECEAKKIQTILAAAIPVEDNVLDKLLDKHNLKKTLRIASWIERFLANCRGRKISGTLTSEELEKQRQWFVRRTQQKHKNEIEFQKDKEYLNLTENQNGIYVCTGRITGLYPTYLPRGSILAEKIVEAAHLQTLHGGTGLTMTKVRERFWIPKLRSLTKRIRRKCNGCKRFNAIAFPSPPPGQLPAERTTATTKPFKIIGLDYAGPFVTRNDLKAYILLFTCSLSRAIHLELLTNQTTEAFITGFKRLIARRGLPDIIYSDNAKTFKASAIWLKRVLHSAEFGDFISSKNVQWRFNLSRAPWWGGQFERLVGLVKQSLYKTIGKSSLTFAEFEDVLLDVETVLNNRPLGYNEDENEKQILTPNTLIHGEDIILPQEDIEVLDESPVRKRLDYINRCKENAWKRWEAEYVLALRERHKMKHKTQTLTPSVGDVVMIKGDSRNRGSWNIGIVVNVFQSKDNAIRAVRLKTKNGHLERAVQHLYPLELTCDNDSNVNQEHHDSKRTRLNAAAEEFHPRRSKRTAAVISEIRTKDTFEHERLEPQVEQ